MSSDVLVAILALVGTIFGSLLGVFSMSKLLSYRIGILEEKVNKYSDIYDRVMILETKIQDKDNYINDKCE